MVSKKLTTKELLLFSLFGLAAISAFAPFPMSGVAAQQEKSKACAPGYVKDGPVCVADAIPGGEVNCNDFKSAQIIPGTGDLCGRLDQTIGEPCANPGPFEDLYFVDTSAGICEVFVVLGTASPGDFGCPSAGTYREATFNEETGRCESRPGEGEPEEGDELEEIEEEAD
jgi:hypothetical protein